MKPTFLTLSLILFALTICFSLAFAQVSEQVFDTNGNPIFPGGTFYIMPSIFGAAGGGLRLGKTKNSKCPLTVLQDYSEVVNGLPVKFTRLEAGHDIISTNTALDIAFTTKPDCAESSKWVLVDDFNKLTGPWVGIGGTEDNEGKHIINGFFKIQKHGFGYKLVFCPDITAPPGACYDIGRHDDFTGRLLVLANNDPYEVVFVDAMGN
ncbi:kunitz-type trypsin inhibitor-like 2 protein [Medicago truncatula]|uniref:Kunitz type trypsin inhibitor / Alpha-fucosidase n=1 Tax=Medicago truncatula TaxID=3880 RepID=G7KP86_MEDTR|nr:kunitz-type trypsin inhibitor-like 2 protein [Medicago truncatula]AES75961.2 Kunitz type trypsin inhibitor / Alpha-fucosidase [Medicago truncatula]